MSRAPPRGGDSERTESERESERERERERERQERRRRRRLPSRRREPKRSAAETALTRDPAGRAASRRPRRRDGEKGDGLADAPGTATEDSGKEEQGYDPRPRRSRLACARQHTARYPRGTHPQTAARTGVEPGGEARASPPLSRPLSDHGGVFETPSSLSLSPRPPPPHRAARPRQGRAPPQRLVPGAGSYGALPESAFRGTKALRGSSGDDDRDDDEAPPGRRERGPRPPRETLPSPNPRTPPSLRAPAGTTPPPPPPPPPTAGNGPARRPQPRRRGGPRAAIDRHATLRQAGDAASACPCLFGGGPGARARPDLRTEKQRDGPAEGRRPARPRSREQHAFAAAGARPPAPAHARNLRLDRRPRTRGTPPRQPRGRALSSQRPYNARRRRAATTDPPEQPLRGTASHRPKGESPAGAALRTRNRGVTREAGPPPRPEPASRAPEACRSARPTAAGAALPGPPPLRTVGNSLPAGSRPAAGVRRLSRGATPAPLVSTRGPGRGSAPAAAPARLPSAHTRPEKGNGEATDGARAGTAAGDGGRLPADHPPGGTLVRAATPPHSARGSATRTRRASGDDGGGPPSAHPREEGAVETQRWPVGGTRRRAFEEKAVEGREARSRPDAAPHARPRRRPRGESVAGPGGRNPAAEVGQRARALCRRRPVSRGERVGPAAGSRAAASPPRPGPQRGGGRAPLPGAARVPPPRARARGGTPANESGTERGPVATDTIAGDRRE
ncbi:basic proline-rich protein-like [Oenanthe melanoleuca]|uniref:basic proline-rich protein-like n=1 Tax=Oenanthe melanoleuca TaxID=2939378 RepID=UPI0024C10706|nr:basic proline-rich protein-like [Oenanthe melanoleuca]